MIVFIKTKAICHASKSRSLKKGVIVLFKTGLPPLFYSHSILAGGLVEMS